MTKLLKSRYTNDYDPEEGETEVWGNEWIGNDKDEIIAFACFGDSEENDEVIAKIKEYKAGKDYVLTQNKNSYNKVIKEKYDEYQIINLQLRKDLKEFIDQEEDYSIHLKHLKPLKLDGLIEPIEPVHPIKPVGKPKENKKWQEYRKKNGWICQENERLQPEIARIQPESNWKISKYYKK